jgi:polyphosphate kinase 2 (PPK2 family)
MGRLKGKEYRDLLAPLQEELVGMARWIETTGARVVVLFEGRDTAGKGGAIHTIASHLNPRHCRIVALGKPSEAELGQWYFQRYIEHLPTKGEIVLFDRS